MHHTLFKWVSKNIIIFITHFNYEAFTINQVKVCLFGSFKTWQAIYKHSSEYSNDVSPFGPCARHHKTSSTIQLDLKS